MSSGLGLLIFGAVFGPPLILAGVAIALGLRLKRANQRIEALEGRVTALWADLQLRRAKPRADSAPAAEAEATSARETVPPSLVQTADAAAPVAGAGESSTPTLAGRPTVSAASPHESRSTSPAAPRAAGTPPRPPRPPRQATASSINWEQFMGVKLFAWLGGLGLFLGVGFFVKYSFEHELIPPEVRVALGFLVGVGLLAAGVAMAGRRYEVTAQTLCGTGVVILYAVTFACRSVYHFEFFGLIPTFLLMTLITTTAFLLAVRLDALVVAILGMLGGFLTPILLSSGQDNPFGLFGYVALLDIGLMAVALHRRWHFLLLAGAAGTVLTQAGWAATFFTVPKAETAIAVFLAFSVLFLAGFLVAHGRRQVDRWVSAAAISAPVAALIFTAYLLSFAELGQRPGLIFLFVFLADACLLTLAWMQDELAPVQVGAGMAVFLLLAVWTNRHVSSELLDWGLGLYLVFALLHSAAPVSAQRLRARPAPAWWTHLFPALALLLIMLPIANGMTVSMLLWPVVLLIDLLAIVLALLIPSVLAVLGVLVLTVAAAALWISETPASVTVLPPMLLVIGAVAVFFLAATALAVRWLPERASAEDSGAGTRTPWLDPAVSAGILAQLPALSAILPFLLLLMLTNRLPLADPSPVFGLALVLVVLLLGLTWWLEMEWLPAVGLLSALALAHAWHVRHFRPDQALGPLLWYLGFYAIFLLFPFVLRPPFATRVIPWATAALAGPLHFFLVYRAVALAFPNTTMGLLPTAFALPTLLGLVVVLRTAPVASATRHSLLAWFGGASLFFITLIFPIQFERQWLTLAWALEGAALLWLYHRVPHRGLPLAGVGLLLVAFGRLALNPAVLFYYPRSATPILNWYLYAYGVVIVCLFAGARLLRPPRHLVLGRSAPPVLMSLGTVLAFLLVNIEIADYFTGGSLLRFRFAGNLAQDMTYSIAWAVFALVLIVVGLVRRMALARYAGIGLLGVTLIKLFLHDLAHLAQLYRIGALLGVAVIALLASLLYQRFLGAEGRQHAAASAPH